LPDALQLTAERQLLVETSEELADI